MMTNVGERCRDLPAFPTRKALTVWQPWASLLVAGIKTYETRSWPTRHRGPLLIHAAKRWGGEQEEALQDPDVAAALRDLPQFDAAALPRAAIVGWVEVVECQPVELVRQNLIGTADHRQLALGNYTAGRFAWRCVNAHQLDQPFPCRGKQRLFNI